MEIDMQKFDEARRRFDAMRKKIGECQPVNIRMAEGKNVRGIIAISRVPKTSIGNFPYALELYCVTTGPTTEVSKAMRNIIATLVNPP